jgi:hypothetical protein
VKPKGRISIKMNVGPYPALVGSASARVIRRPSLPERVVGGVYYLIDSINLGRVRDTRSGTMHVGTTIETEPVRDFLGIRAKS